MRTVTTLPVSTRRSTRRHPSRTPARPATYTVDEAARLLGISRSHAYTCVKTGELPCLRFRRRIVIPAHSIDELLSSVGTLSS